MSKREKNIQMKTKNKIDNIRLKEVKECRKEIIESIVIKEEIKREKKTIKTKEIFQRKAGFMDINESIKKKIRNFIRNINGFFGNNNLWTKAIKINILNIMNNENKRKRENKSNRENKIITNTRYIWNYINLFILLIINSFVPIFLRNNEYCLKSRFSNISLKIIGIGNQNILGSIFNNDSYPNEIYINQIKQDIINCTYYFNQTENSAELVWNKSVNDCRNMFYGCSSLISLNLSNFDTSNVNSMSSMFSGCSSLVSLNLSNFDTSNVKDMSLMFSGCANLEYINLINFDESRLHYGWYYNFFEGVPNNFVVCINKEKIANEILLQITEKTCYTIDCSNNWKSNQKKIINGSINCTENCFNNPTYKYEYNGMCYENCSNGFLIDDNNIESNKCKCELEKCLTCPPVALKNKLCTKCNINYYPKEDDHSNIGEYFDCYREIKGYYLDKKDSIFKKCYYTCETCEIKGDHMIHNCLECNSNFPINIKINNYTNCYQNCSYYYYFDEENNYQCTINSSCPNEYELSHDSVKCIKNKKKASLDDILNLINYERNQTKEMTKVEYYDAVIKNVEALFTKNYDTTKLDNGKDEVKQIGNMKITFTTMENQKNNLDNNMTAIDLGECANTLRSSNNLRDNERLYMKKIDIKDEIMKIPKVELDVYYKSGSDLIRLNLSVCDKDKILLSVPIEISEDINKLNSSSEYYNSKCSSSSEDNVDKILKDRQDEFIQENKAVCQEYCDFTNYNFTIQKADCSCIFKESSKAYADMKINKEELMKRFKDLNNKASVSNLDITSCNVLGSKENIISNTGFFLLLVILAIFLIVFIIFCTKGYNLLEDKIDEVIHKKFGNEPKSKNNKIHY